LELQDEDDHVLRSTLKTVKGIGDWTVDMYLLFGLARLDVFPVHDLALRRIMCEVYKVPQDDLRKLERISSHWKPYRSVGSWYLYKYANMNT
jgi:DNA-3-methyladenine glycosylase II